MCNFFLFVSFIASVQVRIFPLNIRDIIIYFARWWEKYLSKRSLIKHTCSWRDKLIVLWTLNRQAKIFLRISVIVLIFHHMLWVINKIMQAASISLVFTLLSALVLIKIYVSNNHYVKNIRIRRFSCRYFPAFVLKENTDQKNSKYGHFLRSKWKRSCYKRLCLSFLIIARPYNFCSYKLPRKIGQIMVPQ